VGNYAARCARPVFDSELCGDRVLTVLNSWDKGDNVIQQQLEGLPAGTYRVLMDVRYECPNETARGESFDGQTITTSGGNVNTSRTGVVINGHGVLPPVQHLRYPSQANTWEQMAFDFEITEAQPIATISLGYQSSQSQGAANQTLLYIDNVRLLVRNRLMGDVNNDGIINVTDVSAIISHILGKQDEAFDASVADLNNDGVINVTDVSAVINIILGK
jgi:hypothetical protein